MELTRHELRYKTMTILYQIFLYKKNNIEVNIDSIINEQLEEKNTFVEDLVKGILDKNEELEKIANDNLTDWKLDRLGFTDQAILKIGLYELLYTDIPPKVCIDEAIELSKKYSDEKVSNMINAVLDKVYHNNKEENNE